MEQEKTCIVSGDLDCEKCDIKDKLICEIDVKKARMFVLGNTLYRLTALMIFPFIGLMTNQWWWIFSYGILIGITFIFIEPRLLCRHFPHYARPGKYLKCWALRGMPKLQRYDPGKISKAEKNTMLILGSLIDLFPFIGVIYGIVMFLLNPINQLLWGIGLILTTLVFIYLVYYFSKVLLGDACKRCPNFSCGMNKVPKEIVDKFLEINSVMKKVWESKN